MSRDSVMLSQCAAIARSVVLAMIASPSISNGLVARGMEAVEPPRAETVRGAEDDPGQPKETPRHDPATAERYAAFEKSLSGVRLVGHFTMTGLEQGALKKEEYEIRGVKKMPNGNMWLFQTRIRYGTHDLTIPLPLQVEWAGDTPVITLDNLTIPGLGTYGARVVIHDKRYAGTWSHGDVGGHLFGAIEKLDPAAKDETKNETKNGQ